MITLLHGDCLNLMTQIPNKSIDMVLTDPPYGTTACKWDVVIPFEPMWKELKRVIKDNGCIALFGSEPFSSHLRLSNLKMFKYDWIWVKNRPSGIALAKTQPMRNTEIISLFYKNPRFYPILREKLDVTNRQKYKCETWNASTNISTLKKTEKKQCSLLANPNNTLYFNSIPNGSKINKRVHPTQKPVPLLEYLIKTYTLENETVLDFTMGSGSTGVACKNLGRKFIGIEKDENYFNIAKQRIENHIITKEINFGDK